MSLEAAPTPLWRVCQLAWAAVLTIVMSWISIASLIWQVFHPNAVYNLLVYPNDHAARVAQAASRSMFVVLAAVALVPAALHAALHVRRVRRTGVSSVPYACWPALALAALPVLTLPYFELEHVFFAGVLSLLLLAAFVYAAARFADQRGVVLPELSPRAAFGLVAAGYVLFVAHMGFVAHWRVITFHALPYDFSWELNALAGIVRHGVPTISTGANDYYVGRDLPAIYFNLHAPLIYYALAPFYALYRDPRTVVWLQAAFMGTGIFGTYLIGRSWFRHRTIAALLSLVYVLHPQVQGYCLHDVHANTMAIPLIILAVGLMEAQRTRWALAAVFAAALCREETGVLAASVGLFWMFSAQDRRRFTLGLVTVAVSSALFVLIGQVVMPAFGGEPRLRHFSLFFDKATTGGLLKSFVLNPIGTFWSALAPFKLEHYWVSFMPAGFAALLGGRAAWLLLPLLPLVLVTEGVTFYAVGVNYAAPITAAAIVVSFAGIKRAFESSAVQRLRMGKAALTGFVLGAAVIANVFYGNIFAKTYKFEFGSHPHRQNERRFQSVVGVVTRLPPYGQRERDLWSAIRAIPKDVPIASSWLTNAAVSDRDIAFVYPYVGDAHKPQFRARYVLLDKLPQLVEPTEAYIAALRQDRGWRVFYENSAAVVFERTTP